MVYAPEGDVVPILRDIGIPPGRARRLRAVAGGAAREGRLTPAATSTAGATPVRYKPTTLDGSGALRSGNGSGPVPRPSTKRCPGRATW